MLMGRQFVHRVSGLSLLTLLEYNEFTHILTRNSIKTLGMETNFPGRTTLDKTYICIY